jgi:hypothetical protein
MSPPETEGDLPGMDCDLPKDWLGMALMAPGIFLLA